MDRGSLARQDEQTVLGVVALDGLRGELGPGAAGDAGIGRHHALRFQFSGTVGPFLAQDFKEQRFGLR